MLDPLVASGVKERHEVTAHRVDAREVWSLMEIASVAGQRKIVRSVGAAVLLRHDMFDVMGKVAVLLAEKTILAMVVCPLSNEIPRGGIHR
jgi:hypothetical protein